MQGLIGKKIGMTQVWDAQGKRVAVTVIEVGPCPVVQVKAPDKDGYAAVQLGYGGQKAGRMPKALAARYAQAGWRLALVARRAAELEAWARAQGVGPERCAVYAADVQRADSIVAAGQACIAAQGLPDVVVANAENGTRNLTPGEASIWPKYSTVLSKVLLSFISK